MKPRLSLIGQAQQARHGEALQRAREQLALWRARHGVTASATVVSRAQLAVLGGRLLLTAGPVLALLWTGRPLLMTLWQQWLAAWSSALQLPVRLQAVAAGGGLQLVAQASDDGTVLPSLWGLGAAALASLLLWWASARLPDAWLPLRVLLRALLGVQAVALLLVALSPAQFPYTLGSHLSTLLNLGYGFLLAVPVLLALGWGVLALPLWQRLLVPLALVAYLALLLPHKALLQVWLLAHSSVLYMPVLFVALGPLFDLMVFVALYGVLLSLRPAAAPARSTAPGTDLRALPDSPVGTVDAGARG